MNPNGHFIASLKSFADIDAKAVGTVITVATDIALLVTAEGVVQEVFFGTDFQPANDISGWSGTDLAEIVTEESRPKIADMLARASRDETPRWREVNHISATGEEFPVRYAAIPAGTGGNLILLGRDLRMVAQLQKRLVQAQLTMEQDYERIRQIETRYRVLFETTKEALVIVASDSGRIVDANSAAARLFGRDPGELASRAFAGQFHQESQTDLAAALALVRESGRERSISVRTRGERRLVGLDVLLFRSVNETLFLCRLTPRGEGVATDAAFDQALAALYHRAGDAIVLTDGGGLIRWANTAFLAMTDVAIGDSVREASLGEFLGRPSVDLAAMMQNAREKGRVSIYATTVRSAYGVSLPVEISAAFLPDLQPEGFGFVLRDMTRSAAAVRPGGSPVSSDSVEHIIELVGSTPLRELVRGTTDVVEKLCIETALKLTGNNRASAAEMLGLSRQSLYVKLRKYGLIDHEDGASG